MLTGAGQANHRRPKCSALNGRTENAMKIALILCPALLCLDFGALASAQTKSKGKPYIEPPAIHCLALSPDGKTLALAKLTKNIRLWHVADRKDMRAFPIGRSRESYISALAFSPDGKTLAVAGSGRLEVWDVETGKLRMTFKHQVKATVSRLVIGDDGALRRVEEAIVRPDDVTCVTFSKDGKTLFSSGKENFIKVWDPATGMEKAKLAGHATAATHLSLSGDGKALASGTFYGEIKVWDLENQKEIASFANGRSVYGLALSADGKKLLASSGADAILWDVAKKEPLGKFTGARGNVGRVAFSPDDKLVVAQGIEFVVWDANTFEKLATFEHSPVFNIVITPDRKTLLSCDRKGNVKVHEMPKR
jgi:WD40 repeat protein